MFDYNKNYKRRDNFLFGGYNPDEYRGGIRYIEKVTATDIKYLLDMRFIDPDECQNYGPSIREILKFLKANPHFYAFGYAVSPVRSDYRITLEGVRTDEDVDIDKDELIRFIEFAKEADRLRAKPNCYAYWD